MKIKTRTVYRVEEAISHNCVECDAPIGLTAHSAGQAERLMRMGYCRHHATLRAQFRRNFRMRQRAYRLAGKIASLTIRTRAAKQGRGGQG